MDILRRGSVRGTLIVLAMVAVIAVGLFVVYHQSTPGDPKGLPGAPHSGSTSTRATEIKASSAPAARGRLPGSFASYKLPLSNPKGFTFRLQPVHTVLLQVLAAGTVARLGYLVPTSLETPYGDRRNVPAPWSKTLHAGGSGYLAAIFIQTNASGLAVTCRITIDGTLRETETFKGSYARGVCAA